MFWFLINHGVDIVIHNNDRWKLSENYPTILYKKTVSEGVVLNE